MWKLYSRCPYCKREIEVLPSKRNRGKHVFEIHYNLKYDVCDGSDETLVIKTKPKK